MDDTLKSLRAAIRRAFEMPIDAARQDLYTVSLSGHEPTGFTIHRRGSYILPKPAALIIARVTPDPGFYLLYMDEDGHEITDTYHDSEDSAFEQAEAEFAVSRAEWTKPTAF